ncbi:MAG: alpha-1,2-fucosyltransferase [Verrucomicrobiales bacterium]|nr:alpha-1,2-fucosyltransferase [Verrucomicrobiales bacterium]
MFQYSGAWVLNRRMGIAVETPRFGPFSKTGPIPGARQETDGEYVICRTNILDLEKIEREFQGRRIKIAAHLENLQNFLGFESELKELFELPAYRFDSYRFFKRGVRDYEEFVCDPIGPGDVVVSLRLGDFLEPLVKINPPHRLLLYDYFRIAIDRISFDRLFITSDEPFHPFVNEFWEYDPIIVQNEDPYKTMAFVTLFNKILISQSTFSWWAAFLSNASDIYFPIPKTGPWSNHSVFGIRDLDLRVNESRYHFVSYEEGEIYQYDGIPERYKNPWQIERDRR